ncbi:hypothetical protein [Phytopseudomonas dryadis]|uniref:Uncharacterized protein n=1 Tax=Phytopseudomonas dryadis TaxID=2487520 RepID=A0A4Q9QRM7_9GAMM|nr:hypothetical protein [Pseudomonas dryadis]TBU82956.1 hypothetical protein DNK44_25845 [Pseudomonas dryadis]
MLLALVVLRYPPSPGNILLIPAAWLAFALCLGTWQTVGVWRSSRRHKERGGHYHWTVIVRGLMIASVLYSGYALVADIYPMFRSAALMTLNPNALPPYQVRLLPDDQLEFAGGLSSGSASALEQSLKEHPHVRVLHWTAAAGCSAKRGRSPGSSKKEP